ncbi:MAG TPA: hypothetical protein VFD84_18445 [Candidatus Binatia bacterium]|nr:hypothetical protein [Candidatus Binatia bacterium]
MGGTGQCVDIGGTVPTALARFERARDPASGSTDPSTAGNGSLMRLAPGCVPLRRTRAGMASANLRTNGGGGPRLRRRSGRTRCSPRTPTSCASARCASGTRPGFSPGAPAAPPLRRERRDGEALRAPAPRRGGGRPDGAALRDAARRAESARLGASPRVLRRAARRSPRLRAAPRLEPPRLLPRLRRRAARPVPRCA